MTLLIWLTATGGALSAIGSAVRWVLIPLVRWGKRMDARTEYIDSEMRRNGGKTARDQIAHCATRLDSIDGRLSNVEASICPKET